MNFNAWMPLQGTTGNSYDYAARKSNTVSENKKQNQKAKEKNQDSMWDIMRESYAPSAEAQNYKVSAAKTGGVKLSDRAQKLLEELKEKYGNMDFFVASYSSEEEAQSYLRQGTKEYSVLIDPETLEAMAADSKVRAQYEDVLAGAGDRLMELKEQLGDDADQVKSFGISIDSEGKVSYFAELDKLSESRNQQLERAKERRAEEKAEEKAKEKKAAQEKAAEKSGEIVKADSIEGLLQKIREALGSSVE